MLVHLFGLFFLRPSGNGVLGHADLGETKLCGAAAKNQRNSVKLYLFSHKASASSTWRQTTRTICAVPVARSCGREQGQIVHGAVQLKLMSSLFSVV